MRSSVTAERFYYKKNNVDDIDERIDFRKKDDTYVLPLTYVHIVYYVVASVIASVLSKQNLIISLEFSKNENNSILSKLGNMAYYIYTYICMYVYKIPMARRNYGFSNLCLTGTS